MGNLIWKNCKLFYRDITRTELIIEYYESVVTCRGVLEFREIFYFGEYHCFLFETIWHKK